MITRPDDDPDLDPDDPLTILLRPPADHLGPPPGRYEAIRRGATRRKLLRAAAGAALTCGVAALAILPLRLTASDAPTSPTVPLAPPPATSPPSTPLLSPTPEPVDPSTGTTSPTAVPTSASEPPSEARTTPSASPSIAPSAEAPSATAVPGP